MESSQSRGRAPSRSRMGEAVLPDLVLVHPAVDPETLRCFAPSLWEDDDLRRSPEGYREISAAFHGLRAFCRAGLEASVPAPDPALAGRVRDWVDALAHQWDFPEVFAVRELNFWAFLRNRMIRWLHERMAERRVIEGLAGPEPLALVAIGLDPYHRTLLRALADSLEGRVRPEIAFGGPPAPVSRPTLTEQRFRKLFFLLQDAWHGMQLLAEDVFVRRPKVLLASDVRCWRRSRATNGGRTIDVHLESVWREGRQRPMRLYYRTGSYDPDVGAMTSSRLAPTYLAHFLFLLDQTSRGFWEVWRIHRQWRQLREKPEFREALTFDGLPIAEIVLDWLDQETSRRLPLYVRSTRRETYFLRGTRPNVVLLTHEQDVNRPILVAAKRLGIPTVGLQLRPFHEGDHAYLLSQRDPGRSACLPDRLCVFGQEAKAFLVERGAFDPSTIVVTGDPRRDGPAPDALRSGDAIARTRKRWGVEGDRQVIGLACRPTECPEVLAWMAEALEGRDDAFVVLCPLSDGDGGDVYHRFVPAHSLRWFHPLVDEAQEDWREGIDIFVTTAWYELAEALARRTRAVLVEIGGDPPLAGLDPGSLAPRAADAEGLRRILQPWLAQRGRLPIDEAWCRFVRAVYGEDDGQAGKRIVELIENLARGV